MTKIMAHNWQTNIDLFIPCTRMYNSCYCWCICMCFLVFNSVCGILLRSGKEFCTHTFVAVGIWGILCVSEMLVNTLCEIIVRLFTAQLLSLSRWRSVTVSAPESGQTRSWRSVLLLSRCCWCLDTAWHRRRQLNLHWKHPLRVLVETRLMQLSLPRQPAVINMSHLPSGKRVQVCEIYLQVHYANYTLYTRAI